MSTSVQMPAFGESVTEGTVTRWLKAEGDRVEVDEPLLEVSTDKVDTEIPSPVAGVLEKILVAEDETAQVGADLAVMGDGSGSSASGSGAADTGSAAPDPAPEPEATTQPEEVAETPSTAVERPAEKPTAEATPTGSGTSVTLPAMGESVTEGTVTRWLKQIGDHVDVDEPLVEVSTDKVDTEVPSPVAGTLLSISVGEDETVQVGGELAVIGSGAPTAASPAASTPAPAESTPAPAQAAPVPSPSAPASAPEPTPAPAAAESAPTGADSGSGSDSGSSVTLPAMGESVTEGTVTRWLKQIGDHVDVDEPLVEVSTDKVDTEVPSPVAGTLLSISVAEDETVQVGGELAVIGSGAPTAASPAAPAPAAASPAAAPAAPAEDETTPAVAPQRESSRRRHPPLSRRRRPRRWRRPHRIGSPRRPSRPAST